MARHKYYHEDTAQRKKYFETQFFSLAKRLATEQGISFETLLSRVEDFDSFKDTLDIVWSGDGSLSAYFSGMDDSELKEFFERPAIQKLIDLKIPDEEEIPDEVLQVDKKTQKRFVSKIKEKATGKTVTVFAKEEEIEIKGEKRTILRDSKGRFAKKGV